MKKIIMIVLCSLTLSCMSMMYSDVSTYKVVHEEYDSLEHPFTIDSVKIYRDILFEISVLKWKGKDFEHNTIDIDYSGSSWLFMDGGVVIKADDEIIKINDPDPHRRTRSGGVLETVSASISDEDLTKLANATTVRIQFHGDPVDISELGISFIDQFISEY